MTFKIAAYGVRENEIDYFKNLNKYNYELKLIPELLTHENIDTAQGMDAVLLRANCVADADNLNQLKDWGIKYVFTRTVGYNHIDLTAAHANNQVVARVPSYSPHAVADLAFSLGLTLQRHISLATYNSQQKDFQVKTEEFSQEIHDLTVGIIGTGRIGVTEAQNYQALGAQVLGYDVFQSDAAKEVVEFVDQEELFQQADIVSLHVPYFPGKNDRFVNAELISLMKPTAVLINTARAEIVDVKAVIQALQNQKLGGFATDVIDNEKDYLGKKINQINDPNLQALIDLYPRAIITPHIGSYTKEALRDMITISYDNFNDVLTTGTTKNLVEE
ncbi:lactate dehydrogenase [Bombilactobacillus bombi]|uniref:NAD(P)-dependent oxidoreductase n=1 Tax=Bombilactobacillus bombi TaxID=1303590 RepID=UPI000E569646|nr:NAD(P)-dependent oxidoreductase [Bombilactobacillus bombi]AXX65437.1 lactate dehydrogenase [Bombilactobacillus bombi]MCO6540748.1 lactate dehydrogenase [Lactobacillus sp.]